MTLVQIAQALRAPIHLRPAVVLQEVVAEAVAAVVEVEASPGHPGRSEIQIIFMGGNGI